MCRFRVSIKVYACSILFYSNIFKHDTIQKASIHKVPPILHLIAFATPLSPISRERRVSRYTTSAVTSNVLVSVIAIVILTPCSVATRHILSMSSPESVIQLCCLSVLEHLLALLPLCPGVSFRDSWFRTGTAHDEGLR